MNPLLTKKLIIGLGALLVVVALIGFFFYGLMPASADVNTPPVIFEVKQGEGFRTIVQGLGSAGLIRSSFAAEAFSLVSGEAHSFQPGLYKLSPGMSALAILGQIASNAPKEVTVVIPEGSNLYQIDAILSDALVIRHGALVNFRDDGDLEGKLFPDTYRFFSDADIKDVVQKFLDNFNIKAAPLLAADAKNATSDLILASIVEKEVPDPNDQKIVAGILEKRLNAGIPLDVDATVCYAKLQNNPSLGITCYPLTTLDLKIESPYNSYLYKGLPPGPIGNPGISAINAALNPKSSLYWFYLSDPKTGKTIFAKTLDEQHTNTVKYLKGN